MYRKVLVPLDRSELAECSLSHVKDMAKEGSLGEVILLSVAVIDIPYEYAKKDFDFSTFWDAQMEKTKVYLAGVQEKLRAEGIKTETVVVEVGWPSQIIIDYADQNSVDLIVIASHGETGMKKLMFGSVALRVLHDSHVPVLLIRPESCRG
jgi:nucleotide-binding universal stress UspA family protein